MIRIPGLCMLLLFLLSACQPSDDVLTLDGPGPLTIYGTTDIQVFHPVIDDFRKLYPQVDVRYVELDAAALYQRYLDENARNRPTADLLISSAMDLQVKLVNDGYARPHHTENAAKMPDWARWRDEVFGITFEPAVMVFNRELMRGRVIPKSRPELLHELRRDPGFWRGRIGSYDVAKSSVGYLLASQDARQNPDFGALLEAFGASGLQTSTSTAVLLNEIESGHLALGYNLLGSYARARIERGARLMVIYPADYTLAVSRAAILPRNAPHQPAAHAFLEYLLSLRGQHALATLGRLSASRPEIIGPYSQMGIMERQIGPLRPIPLGPGLLAYLDQQKQRRLVDSWERALGHTHKGTLTGR
ncbi:ABC transporter substrate-binding protein [soil metagenome]